MINYYRRFIPKMAATLVPLHEAVKAAGPGKNQKIIFTDRFHQAFKEIKTRLSAAVLLHHPNPFSSTSLTVDASEVAVGGELAQRGKDQSWRPIAFFSHALTPAEKKYSAFDRELLAMYLAVRHFKHFLEGKPFVIFTDHKPLAQAITSSTDNRSPRQTRQLSYVAEFTSDVRHIKGNSNVVADALSRPSVQEVSPLALPVLPSVDFKSLAAAQDPGALLDSSDSFASLVLRRIHFKGVDIWCDTAGGRVRPLVPVQFRRSVFDSLHGLSHGGCRPTLKLITSKYVWPGMRKEIREWCRTCLPCQTAKVGRHTRTSPTVLPPADRRFGSIHVDLVGPLPDSPDGHKYLLTIVDRFSRWPEAFPLKDMASTTCCRAFIHEWLPRFGIPDTVVTDRGSQFIGGAWKEMMDTLGITALSTTAYHPQCNGLVERMHRQLKGAIRARLSGTNWMDCLPLVLLGLRSAWRSGPDAAPAQLLYGAMLRLPGEFLPAAEVVPRSSPHINTSPFISNFQKLMREQRSAPSDHHPSSLRPFIPKDLHSASMVLVRRDGVRRPLQSPYDGPFPVLESGEKVFKILKNGLPYSVSIDRLKACNMPVTSPSSIVPNTNPPPMPTSSSSSPSTPAMLSPPSSIHFRPQTSPEPSAVSGRQDTSRVPASETCDPLGLQSETEFPALRPPVKTSSGRLSRPRVRMDL